MVRAIWLVVRVFGGIGAECLSTIDGVLRCNYHGNGVVYCEHDQGQHYRCHEQCLGRGMAFTDFKKPYPKESDTNCGNACDGAAEEVENQEGHENVVDWEDLGGLNEYPIDRLKDVNTKILSVSFLYY